ncbi:MAG: hypothetical protein ACLUOI_26285 [Eisenbergiella sp.]
MANRGGFFIHRILDENFFDMVVNNSLSVPMESDAGTTRLNDRYSVIHLPGSEFSMCGLGTYPYHTFPGIYTLNSNISLEQSGISSQEQPELIALRAGHPDWESWTRELNTGMRHFESDGSTRLFSFGSNDNGW